MENDDLMKREEEWFENAKKDGKLKESPKADHAAELKTMQNPIRRNIIKLLAEKKMSYNDIKNEFDLNDIQAKLHIGMLEDMLYIEKDNDSYSITTRAEAYLTNVDSKIKLK